MIAQPQRALRCQTKGATMPKPAKKFYSLLATKPKLIAHVAALEKHIAKQEAQVLELETLQVTQKQFIAKQQCEIYAQDIAKSDEFTALEERLIRLETILTNLSQGNQCTATSSAASKTSGLKPSATATQATPLQ